MWEETEVFSQKPVSEFEDRALALVSLPVMQPPLATSREDMSQG